MDALVTCPACEGRGTYCLRVLDPVWPELMTHSNPCELCSGMGKIPQADADDFLEDDPLRDRLPYFPFRPYDY
jgi:hypothetical protein